MGTLVPARRLFVGMTLPKDLYTRQGIKLLHAGAKIDAGVARAIEQSGEPQLVFASDAAEAVQIAEGADPPTRRAASAIEDKAAFTSASGRPWAVRHHELSKVRAMMLRDADALLERRMPRWSRLGLRARTHAPVAIADGVSGGWFSEEEIRAIREERTLTIARFHGALVRGLPLDAAGLVEMVEELIDLFSRHPRRFVRLAIDTGADGVGHAEGTIESHAFATACLAVATAVRLGWSRSDALHCGLAAILADAGMHLIRTEIRGVSRPLIDVETARVQKHAAMSALLALEIQGLPEAVPMIVLQHHEREDARGYPRFLHALQIHDAARVLAACDCFAAMLAERPHRPAMAATDAVREVWGLAQRGSLRQDVVEALMEISFDMQRVEEQQEAGEPWRRAA